MVDDTDGMAIILEQAYQRGLRDGIKQGLLRAAEICDGEASVEGIAQFCAAAIRAEAEKEGK